jgi:hypothetical protein
MLYVPDFVLFFFLWDWGLNSGVHACKAGILLLEPQLQSSIQDFNINVLGAAMDVYKSGGGPGGTGRFLLLGFGSGLLHEQTGAYASLWNSSDCRPPVVGAHWLSLLFFPAFLHQSLRFTHFCTFLDRRC